MRITQKDIEAVVSRINRITGNALEAYADKKWNIGTYYISGAYGGVKLEQVANDGGGCSDVLSTGYTTKRELYNAMQAFISGLQAKA